MKKVIATAAGLMLVGAMATTALADVNLSGDARARFYTQDNFDLNDDVDDVNQKIDSRVRLAIEGNAGGVLAKARVKIGDGTWDGGNFTGGDVETDYAWVEAPVGPITVSAGRQIINFGNQFVVWDERHDRLKGLYQNDTTTLALFYDKNVEFDTADTTVTVTGMDNMGLPAAAAVTTTTTNAASEANDDDSNGYGAVFEQKFGDWKVGLLGVYLDNEISDTQTTVGSLAINGSLPGVMIVGEIGFVDADTADNTAVGGFLAAVLPMDNLTIILPAAFTSDGMVADGDFKPTYLYGTQGTMGCMGIINFGQLGDTVAVAPTVEFKAADNVTLHGAVAYADVDGFTDITEIDAGIYYSISENATIKAAAAYGMLGDDYDDIASYALFIETKF